MGVNYLHNFTSVLDSALQKYNGIAQAIELENPDEFHKEEAYKDKVVEFRKNLRTKRLVTITEIMNVINDFVSEDTLTLYSIEKAFNFVKQYEGSEKSIKSIMNKFDKTLRSSINKEILDQFNIEATVRRSSEYGKENAKSYRLQNKTKGDEVTTTRNWYNKSTKAPQWNVDLKIPIPDIRVTGESDGEEIDVRVPYKITESNHSDDYVWLDIRICYEFDSFTEFFITSIEKLDDYSKDINLFIKDLMSANDRRISYRNNARKFLRGASLHPYFDGTNWCEGELGTELERAFASMNITDIALSTHRWLTSYDFNRTNPHRYIYQFYNWLPSSAGTGVELMRHGENQAEQCWSEHQSKVICENRDCAFINTCIKYNDNTIEEPEIQYNLDSSVDTVRTEYVSELATIYSLGEADYDHLTEEVGLHLANSGYLENRDNMSNDEILGRSATLWNDSTNIPFVQSLPHELLAYLLKYRDDLLSDRSVQPNQEPHPINGVAL
tara:strand:- start:60 stop:1550 length:1491 start_codon:yes stop_codon:yes gene_type:complete